MIKNPIQIMKDIFPIPNMEKFAAGGRAFPTAKLLVRVFYFFLFYNSIELIKWNTGIEMQVKVAPLWPVLWINWVSFPWAIAIVRCFFMASALLASLFPYRRIFRVLAFVGVFEFASFYMSIYTVDVDWHAAVLVAIMLIFLPDSWKPLEKTSQEGKQKFLFVFWGCQVLIFLTYTMAAIGKFIGAIAQSMLGQVNSFMPMASALHIADRIIVTNTVPPMAPWVIDHPYLSEPFYVGTIYLMTFAFWVVFRPKLHMWWAVGLILFHISSYLTLGIGFSVHVAMLLLFFVVSPFKSEKFSFGETILEVPLLGWVLGKVLRRG